MRKLLFLAPLVIALLLLLTLGTSTVSAAGSAGSGMIVHQCGGCWHPQPPQPPPPPPPQWNYNSGVHKCCSDKDSGGHGYEHPEGNYNWGAQQPYMHQGHAYPSGVNCSAWGSKYYADQYYKYCHGGSSGMHHDSSPSCDDPHAKFKPCVAYN